VDDRKNEVTVSERVDERCFELFAAQGYAREVRGFFSNGWALPFALYQHDAPVAACFAYPNFESVYEIGGVYMLPEARRNRHARQLVETAWDAIIRLGDQPR
jgi:hypothetical protein